MDSWWQRCCIALARSRRLKRFAQGRAGLSSLATRFVGGSGVADAADTAAALSRRGVRASMFYLGEYVTDLQTVARTVSRKQEIALALAARGLDIHVSLDPTQIGYAVDDRLGARNALSIGECLRDAAPRTARSCLMLDMEDSSLTDRTLALRRELAARGIPAAITLQAYLRRTEADLQELMRSGAVAVRLVKGAFAERGSGAWVRRHDIDESYVHLVSHMLSPSARDAGMFPVFATHDEEMIRAVSERARAVGFRPGDYEFEMLYGVRPELQRRVLESGEQLRLYVPFGEDWWPYAVRRVGENARHAGLVLRALATRRSPAP